MKDFMQELQTEARNHDEPMFHYETCNKSTVDIRSFKDYFVTTIETLLISQRKLHIKVGSIREREREGKEREKGERERERERARERREREGREIIYGPLLGY